MTMRARMLGRLAVIALVFIGWLALAGRPGWPQAWVFVVFFLGGAGALSRRLARSDPDLLRERTRPDSEAEPWDRRLIRVYAGLLLAVLAVAALDGGRFRWSVVPWWAQALGWLLMVVCGALVWHVTVTNAFAARHARLQPERGQVVVRSGLYGYLRHPMYLGIVLLLCGLPPALGSWWALGPGLAIVGLFIYRTHREDRMLHDGLRGYADYARDVPYRLVPGVW